MLSGKINFPGDIKTQRCTYMLYRPPFVAQEVTMLKGNFYFPKVFLLSLGHFCPKCFHVYLLTGHSS
jgi:hypothetical protein